jgi:hypothetical protein
MAGQNGNDWYITDNPKDQMFESFDAGVDTIFSSYSRSLLSDFENLTLRADATWGIGNDLDLRPSISSRNG